MATTKAKKTWYFVLGMLPAFGAYTGAQTPYPDALAGFIVGALLAVGLLAGTLVVTAIRKRPQS